MFVGERLFEALHRNTVFLQYNSLPPAEGVYGWLRAGTKIKLSHDVRIEQNSGLYGGSYKAMPGGRKKSGFASIGAFSYSQSALPDGVSVGRYCSISTGLRFTDSVHPTNLLTTSAMTFRPRNRLYKPFLTSSLREFAADFDVAGKKPYPTIGHDVWIGTGVTMNMGINIGTGSIIAANSTVTKDVPPYSIVGGNPAKVIRTRIHPEIAEKLLKSKWWEFEPTYLFEDVNFPLDLLADRILDGHLPRANFRSLMVADFLDPSLE
ncbi:CatB-related O-acetyltransferase [Arthrobacter rhombi]|uniref:CatB-related O-acetyltransferase n=1 Tax=Arthrobacter rhombi TaxID=71253 RepID=UPI003FD2279A